MSQTDQQVFSKNPELRATSFLSFSGPILMGWCAICVLAAAAHDFSSPTLEAIVYLSPVYVGLYLVRMIVLNLKEPLSQAITVIMLLIFVWIPVVYLLSHGISFIYETSFYSIWRIPQRILDYYLNVRVQGQYLDGLVRFSIFLASTMIFLCVIERILIGWTVGKHHLLGLVMSGLVSLALVFQTMTLLLLILAPFPHLFFVWQSALRVRGPETRPTGKSRALRFAIATAVVVYGVAVFRFVSVHGWEGVFWPLLIREHEVRHNQEDTRRLVLNAPQGLGSVSIAGRPYLVPAEYSGGTYGWDAAAEEHLGLSAHVPFSKWIDGYQAVARDTAHLPDRTQNAEVVIRAEPSPIRGLSVLCAHERVHGLRQCFLTAAAAAEYLETPASAVDLLTLQLREQRRLTSFRRDHLHVLMVDDGSSEVVPGAADAIAADPPFVVASCTEVPAFPPETSSGERSLGICHFPFGVEHGSVQASVDPSIMPFWREIRAGVIEELNAWTAAAEGAPRIAVAAVQAAAEHAEWLLHQTVYVAPWCQPDRFLVAALGVEWPIANGFPDPTPHGDMVSPFCGPPVVLADDR